MPEEKKVERITSTHGPRVPRDWVETAAYYHWEKNGRPHGNDFSDWLRAEAEILESLDAARKKDSEPPPQKSKPKNA